MGIEYRSHFPSFLSFKNKTNKHLLYQHIKSYSIGGMVNKDLPFLNECTKYGSNMGRCPFIRNQTAVQGGLLLTWQELAGY